MTPDDSYNFGQWTMRKCGADWQYCDGRCQSCHRAKMTTTSTSTVYEHRTMFADSNSTRND